MDFLRPRAIPALIALALAPCAASAGCEALDGTYRHKADGNKAVFATYAEGPGKARLWHFLNPQERAPELSSTERRTRLRAEPLASTVAFKAAAQGAQLEFFDAQGKSLAKLGLLGDGWRCRGDRLEREGEQLTGLGEEIATQKVAESFHAGADGEIVHAIRITSDDPKLRARNEEAHFKRVR